MKYHVICSGKGAIIGMSQYSPAKDEVSCGPVAEPGQTIMELEITKEMGELEPEAIMTQFRVDQKKCCFVRVGDKKGNLK